MPADPRAGRAGTPHSGPSVPTLTQRLAQASPDVLDPTVAVPALVADVVHVLDGTVLDGVALDRLDRTLGPDAPLSARAAAGVVCWLVTDPAVCAHEGVLAAGAARGGLSALFLDVLADLVAGLSAVREPRTWVHDDEGREEAARALLAVGDLVPAGESVAEAADRWQAVSTAYRQEAARAMAHEARRAEELARALAEKRAKEAAAQYANY